MKLASISVLGLYPTGHAGLLVAITHHVEEESCMLHVGLQTRMHKCDTQTSLPNTIIDWDLHYGSITSPLLLLPSPSAARMRSILVPQLLTLAPDACDQQV